MPARYVASERPTSLHATPAPAGETALEWIRRQANPKKGGLTFEQWLAKGPRKGARSKKRGASSAKDAPPNPEGINS